jgi:hypothetical protein
MRTVIESPARMTACLAAACVTLALLVMPSNAHAFSKAIWGPPYQNGHNQFPIYRQLGVKIIEADLHWDNIAPTQPKSASNPRDRAYLWPKAIQQTVSLAKRYHMKVLLQIIGAPRWSNGNHPSVWAPRPSAYATFAATAARKYPSVHLWMIWGEPNRSPNFMPETPALPGHTLDAAQKVAPHNYARILDAAYGSLKKVSKSNMVIGGSTYTTGDIDTQQWIENLRLPNGRPPRMDMYAHNPFTFQAPSFSLPPSLDGEVQFSDLPRLAGWIDRYLRRGMPIFLSEWTIPTQVDEEFDYYVDPPVQAQWIRDALRLSRHYNRIYALGWIHVYDDPPESYGGLITAQGVHKPGFAAFAHG